MAKTFKNLPRPNASTASKPTSERDFFDLTDEPEAEKKGAEKLEKTRNTDNISKTGNISNTGNTNNTSNTDNTVEAIVATQETKTGIITPTVASDAVRQTFVLNRGHLEQLRDYVHARRAQGEYTYSQKQALQDALELLFAADVPAPPRPAQVREQEQQHRQRIQQGRQASTGEQ